ncbi:hypothetical protein [Vitreoscilla filiformis]|nr:hypothetical protein [Vitreoscilla filiformis]
MPLPSDFDPFAGDALRPRGDAMYQMVGGRPTNAALHHSILDGGPAEVDEELMAANRARAIDGGVPVDVAERLFKVKK